MGLGWQKHGLEVLALILWHTGISETADEGMLSQYAEQRRGAAPVKTAKEDELVAIGFDHKKGSWKKE